MELTQLIDCNFRGCCLITQGDAILASHTAGYADLANAVANSLETKFATASAGKVFVAVAILQLIEKNILHLEDKLGDLVDFNLNQIDPAITVRQLLTHTSGMPDYFDESVMEDYEELWRDYPNYKIRSNADLLPLFIHKPMAYPRGERFQYNNTGFVLLAMILEKIMSMPFDMYLQLNVFDICGMENTGYYSLDRLPANCANGYIFDKKNQEWKTNIYSVDAKGTGAGGAFTTVGDISLFWNNLLTDRLLSAQMRQNMISCHSGNEKDGYYGYGIWLKKGEAGWNPYFQGGDPGVSFISAHDCNNNTTISLVSNFGDNVWELLGKIQGNYAI